MEDLELSSSEGQKIITVIRVRPVNATESQSNLRTIVSYDDDESGLRILDPSFYSLGKVKAEQKLFERRFNYDNVFFSYEDDKRFSTQEDVYNRCGKPLVSHCIDGFNCSLIAYGQTGSGKTHTMLGNADEPGITPRLCQDIISKISELLRIGVEAAAATPDVKKSNDNLLTLALPLPLPRPPVVSEAIISASFYEIYNEKVYDLLSSNADIACRIREHPNDGAYIENLTLRPISNYGDVNDILDEGHKKRTTAATLMNASSSRSHAVFTIHVEQQLIDISQIGSLASDVSIPSTARSTDSLPSIPVTPPGTKRKNSLSSKAPTPLTSKRQSLKDNNNTSSAIRRYSKINLVDLAGSERVSLTGVSGQQLVEANNINKSLSTLGDVIKALSEATLSSRKREYHVPYRNSVLTWLLKESLSGNSKSTMLAAISPIESSYQETMSTLRYIERVKAIMTHATRNDAISDSSIITSLNQQILQLKRELKIARAEQTRLEADNQDKDSQVVYYRGLLASKSLTDSNDAGDIPFDKEPSSSLSSTKDMNVDVNIQEAYEASGEIVSDNIKVIRSFFDDNDDCRTSMIDESIPDNVRQAFALLAEGYDNLKKSQSSIVQNIQKSHDDAMKSFETRYVELEASMTAKNDAMLTRMDHNSSYMSLSELKNQMDATYENERKIRQYEVEKKNMQQTIAGSMDKIAMLEKELASKNDKLQETTMRYVKLAADRRIEHDGPNDVKLEEMTRSITALEVKNAMLLSERDELQQQLKSLSEASSSSHPTVAEQTLQQQLVLFQQSHAAAIQVLEEMKEKESKLEYLHAEALTMEARKYVQLCTTFSNDMLEMEKNKDARIAELITKGEEEEAAYKASLVFKEEEISKLKASRKKAKNDLANLTIQLDSALKLNIALQEAVEMNKQISSNTIDTMRRDAEAEKQQLSHAMKKDQLVALEALDIQIHDELQGLHHQVTRLSDDKKRLEDHIQASNHHHDDHIKALQHDMEVKHQHMIDDIMAAHQVVVDGMTGDVDELRLRLSETSALSKQYEDKLCQDHGTIASLQEQLDNLSKAKYDADVKAERNISYLSSQLHEHDATSQAHLQSSLHAQKTSLSHSQERYFSRILDVVHQNMIMLHDAIHHNMKEKDHIIIDVLPVISTSASSSTTSSSSTSSSPSSSSDDHHDHDDDVVDMMDMVKSILDKQASLYHSIDDAHKVVDDVDDDVIHVDHTLSKLNIIDDTNLIASSDYEPDALQQALIEAKLKIAEKYAAFDELFYNYRQLEKIVCELKLELATAQSQLVESSPSKTRSRNMFSTNWNA